ncbi:MAG: virulence-associated E family protein [Oscillospiraceae bacterium]|nr:virulence-associated E family protein [Oscillospiraceae bacterium]
MRVAFLRDETGNRRYWTIPVKRIDTTAIFNHTQE